MTTEHIPSAPGPADLWLQLHGDCNPDEATQPVDYTADGVTWCWHKIHEHDVRYVRADLAQQAEPVASAEDMRDAERYRWLRELPNADALNVRFMGADLDACIDAAMKGGA